MNIENIEIIIALVLLVVISFWAIKDSKSFTSPVYYYTGYTGKKSEDKTQQKGMNSFLIFFTIFATYFSAFTVVGLPSMYYSHGIGAFLFLGIGVSFTPIILWVFGKRLIRERDSNPGFYSPVGLLTAPYKSQLLTIVVSIATVGLLIPYLILQVAGIGKFFVSLSNGGISYISGALICCLVVGLYTYRGGAIADAKTDVAQGILTFLGALFLGAVIIIKLSSDQSSIIDVLKEKQLLSLPGPNGYFSWEILLSFGVLFSLICIATPQVSSKLMGASSFKELRPTVVLFPIAGLLIVMLAGFFGLYAAAKLNIATPDFVIGDVLRNITQGSGFIGLILSLIAIIFVSGIVSAAVSTIDSLLLSISAIFGDNVDKSRTIKLSKHKIGMAIILIFCFFLSFEPPIFIADLSKIQVGGLMALLPCILAPLFNIKNLWAGWLSLSMGFIPIMMNNLFSFTEFLGFDAGFANLIFAIFGLAIGHSIFLIKKFYK